MMQIFKQLIYIAFGIIPVGLFSLSPRKPDSLTPNP